MTVNALIGIFLVYIVWVSLLRIVYHFIDLQFNSVILAINTIIWWLYPTITIMTKGVIK